MNLLFYGYSHGTQVDNQEINLSDALQLIGNHQTLKEEKDNYIGFQIPGKEACIQFFREDFTHWIIDIPIYKKGEYIRAVNAQTSTRIVKDLLSDLFDENTRLHQALANEMYEEVQVLLDKKWGIKLIPAED